MCLIRIDKNCGPKYAVKDIICYKVLCRTDEYNRYLSPCINFIYELNKRVSSTFSFYTFFSPLKFSPQKEYNSLRCIKRNFECIEQGLHSFKYLSNAINFNNIASGVVMGCTIPKGSWYYEGIDNELVSDNIIINKELVV